MTPPASAPVTPSEEALRLAAECFPCSCEEWFAEWGHHASWCNASLRGYVTPFFDRLSRERDELVAKLDRASLILARVEFCYRDRLA